MKNKPPKAKWLLLLTCCILLFASRLTAQGSCASALTIISDATIPYSGTVAQSQEQWLKFVAISSDARITVINTNKAVASVNGLDAYFGACTNLYAFPGNVLETSTVDSMVMILNGMNAGETYWIKLSRTSHCSACNTTSAAPYTIKVVTVAPSTVACSCSFLFPPNTNNTCEAVCNGNFDIINTAGIGLATMGQIARACPWQQPIISPSTVVPSPDLYNDCAVTAAWDVPTNTAGAQTSATPAPVAGFSGYAGIYAYSTDFVNGREYICQPLEYTLTNNQRYRVSFKISLAENSGYAVRYIGAYLSSGQPTQSNNTTLGLPLSSLKAKTTTQVTNTSGWVTVTDTFTANGNLSWITIGQFTNDATASPIAVTPAAPNTFINNGAYYFIDSVSIVPDVPVTVVSLPSAVCAGNVVTSIAYDNGMVGNYTWSTTPSAALTCYGTVDCDTIKSIPPGTGSSIYFATTTLTGYGNCTVTRSDTVTWKAGPIVVNAGADQSICTGGSATLVGNSTGTWNSGSWAILNGSTLCSNCTTTTVSPTTTTQYVFTATNTTTGCTRKDTMKVTVTPLAVTIVSPPGATTCSGCFNFTTATAYSTYSWSTNAVNSSGGSTSTLNACWGTPYDTSGLSGNVSVSVVAANGCQGSAYITIPSCCPYKDGQESVFPNLVNDSTTRVDNVTYPTLYTYNAANTYYEATNKQFSINGVYIVDRNTRWLGCEVKMGPNAKIIVRPGCKFETTNSTGANFTKIYACTDMWDGIYVDGTNSGTKFTALNGTVIEDAKNAVVSTNGGNFFIDGGPYTCKFNKNNVGVLIKAYSGTHPGVIRKTIFSCDAPGQTGATGGVTFAGPNCRAPISGKALAGIYIENCTSVTIGDSTLASYRNLFERTKYGIYSTLSNIKVWNNDFKYITTSTIGQNVPPNGVAIFMTAARLTPKSSTIGRAGNYKAKNKFTKCSYGVYANNYMNMNCEYNRFDSCMTAGITTMNCQSNTILINQDSLTECTGTNIQCIQSNNSTVTITYNNINQSQPFVSASYGNTGILVTNSVLVTVNLKIQYNQIKKMRNGIWVSRVNKCKITDNTPINFMSGQPMSQLFPCIGIKLEEVTNSVIRQNAVTWQSTPATGNHDEMFGIHMTNCKNDTISKNTLTKMGSGIFLKGANNPSILACNNMNSCWFGVNFNYLNGYGPGVSINDQIRWTSAGTPYSTGNNWSTVSGGEDMTGRIVTSSSTGINWYYTSSINNPDVSSMFTFSLIGNVTTYTSNGDRCSQMLAPPAQTPVGIRDYTLGGICKTPRTYDTLNIQYQYHDKVFAYRMLRDNPSWMTLGTADDSYYANFYTAQSITNIGKFANVEDSISAGKVTGATSLLATITPSGQYEINRKAMLDVYLQSWAIDSMNLDSTQQAVLLAIINQGMLVGGTAVFDARNMLHLEIHDSSTVRLQNPQHVASAPNIASPVYPNPSNGIVSTDVSLEQDAQAVFELFDVSGRLVGAWKFIGGQGKYTFDASYLPAGTYIYRVRTEGEMLKSDRLIIIKE